jgi:hypothetical protein
VVVAHAFRGARGEVQKISRPKIVLKVTEVMPRHLMLAYDTACALRATLTPPARKVPTLFTRAEYRAYEREQDTILQELGELVEMGVVAKRDGGKYIVVDVETVRRVCKG